MRIGALSPFGDGTRAPRQKNPAAPEGALVRFAEPTPGFRPGLITFALRTRTPDGCLRRGLSCKRQASARVPPPAFAIPNPCSLAYHKLALNRYNRKHQCSSM